MCFWSDTCLGDGSHLLSEGHSFLICKGGMMVVAGVRRLLAAGASSDACSVDGVPALIAAMDTPVTGGDPDNVKVIELLLQAGADPNAAETTYLNACALRYAEWNPPAVARLLLRYGANAKNLPVYDYGNDGNGYVSLMRKHGASIIKYQGVK